MDDVVYTVMCRDDKTGLYDKLSCIFKLEISAYYWIDTNAEDKNNYKVEAWSLN